MPTHSGLLLLLISNMPAMAGLLKGEENGRRRIKEELRWGKKKKIMEGGKILGLLVPPLLTELMRDMQQQSARN